MKKIFSVLLSITLIFSLAACGGTSSPNVEGTTESSVRFSEADSQSSSDASVSSKASSGPEEPSVSEESSDSEEPSVSEESSGAMEPSASGETEESAEVRKDGGTLIAYFSWSGNTEQVAQMIQEETGGDLFENAPGATILDGLSFTESTLGNARSEVSAWLDSLELN